MRELFKIHGTLHNVAHFKLTDYLALKVTALIDGLNITIHYALTYFSYYEEHEITKRKIRKKEEAISRLTLNVR